MANYVDNDKLLQAIKDYQLAVKSGYKGLMPNYIGECIMLIAENFSHSRNKAGVQNFIGYTFREDMVADAVEVCLAAVLKFDTENFDKPFSYFTQCCYYEFISKITKEKRELYTKTQLIKESQHLFSLHEQDSELDFDNQLLECMQDFIDNNQGEVDFSKFVKSDGVKERKRRGENVVGLLEFSNE